MSQLNPFVENNKARINQFLNNLCEVGDFYDTLEVSAYLRTRHPNDTELLNQIDGSIHGTVKEGFDDSHHYERVVQHAFTFTPAY